MSTLARKLEMLIDKVYLHPRYCRGDEQPFGSAEVIWEEPVPPNQMWLEGMTRYEGMWRYLRIVVTFNAQGEIISEQQCSASSRADRSGW